MDPEVRRLVDFTDGLIAAAANKIRATAKAAASVGVFNAGCDRASACYGHLAALSGGKLAAKLSPNEASVVIGNHADMMRTLAHFYRVEKHVEPEVPAGDVRVIVMTARTLSFLRLTADGARSVYAPVYRAVEDNVLRLITVAWRNDRPGGFIFHDILNTRRSGDAFIADYLARISAMERGRLTEEIAVATLAGLVAHGAMRALRPTKDQIVDWTALVGWLEKHGHIQNDNFNGVDLHFGTEEDLAFADELTRAVTSGKA